ncbi:MULTISPECIES: GapS4b family protein [Myroides]|uniref:GapS4b family protein n=1 Tax=Myroides TaxID=76831 RepID=UPI002578F1A7|nr:MULTISPECIES: hypothetical protein [Myroides]MDM1353244.1 hypothetical protein [Myroides marinus]MDM1461161.1 hypothetical protein [Myroides odoratimimus]
MNTTHKDIHKILPYGEQLRGFANQKYITPTELNRVLRERGIFSLTIDKDFTVPLLQTLMLSPKEFDKIRESFSTREDNRKVNSSSINWSIKDSILIPEIQNVNVNNFMQSKLPTCSLERPVIFLPVDNNKNHLRAEIVLKRNDMNKSWYEQTNIFECTIDLINDDEGKGRAIISHTASETKDLAEFVLKSQIQEYKKRSYINEKEELRKIVFNDFTNEERFKFFFNLTKDLDLSSFTSTDIKDISIRPNDSTLPDEIKWMEKLNRIVLSGKSLDKKDFIKDDQFHKHLEVWSFESSFNYDINNQKGACTFIFGFPDYLTKKGSAEFEINISALTPSKTIDSRAKKLLKSTLLAEMDKQKSKIFNDFLNTSE